MFFASSKSCLFIYYICSNIFLKFILYIIIYFVTLTEPIGTDKDGNEINFNDILGSDPDAILDDIHLKMQVKSLYNAISHILTKREQLIIMKRYGISGEEPLTQRELAKELGISRSYVSRIEKKAVGKLRDYLKP
ncbi:sigma-70 family RNA polymerase sigma factor [Aminipila sp.]|uniref:sigma-70 family RNA polymerase sigma factor n=1 Tax=Aminipila sp. TaxID=2060095 RepID=UPI0028981D97|nr:sigma-70 family RNA polymerase sigma factor [Aminipila sp.]